MWKRFLVGVFVEAIARGVRDSRKEQMDGWMGV